ncbi:hypothetical protein Tco_0115823 [Tanacetum coccineum]
MHDNDHSDNVLPVNHNSLENDNSALELLKHENDYLMELLISQDLVHTAVNSLAAINDYKSMQQSFVDNYNETLVLKAELGFFIINELQALLKAKNVSIEKLKEHIANIKGKNVAESVQNVHNSNVELLVYVSATCPSSKPVRVSSFSKTSESNPRSNTKKDKITQTSSSNKKTNKVEDQPRIAKSSLNNRNRISKIVCNANVKHSVLNANSKFIYDTSHECMFDAIHDLYVSDYLNDVNSRVKSKSVKSRSAKSKKKKLWKPTGKVYTKVGYIWKPTR